MINASIFRYFNCKFFLLLLDSSILKKKKKKKNPTTLRCNKNINKYQQHDCPQLKKKKLDHMSVSYDFSSLSKRKNN